MKEFRKPKCLHCNNRRMIINLYFHFKAKHVQLKRKYYRFRYVEDFIDFLNLEKFISGSNYIIRRISQIIDKRYLLYINCKTKKKKQCSTQLIIRQSSDGCLYVYYFGRHNHSIHHPKLPKYIDLKKRTYTTSYNNQNQLEPTDAKTITMYINSFLRNTVTDLKLCPIIAYKPQYENIKLGIYSEEMNKIRDLFILGLRVNSELNSSISKNIKAYSVDLNRKTNIYGYPLITIQALTDFGLAIPLVYFITSEMSETIFTYAFQYYIKPFLSTALLVITNYEVNLNKVLQINLNKTSCLFCLLELQHHMWYKLQEIDDVSAIKKIFTFIIYYLLPDCKQGSFRNLCEIFIGTWKNIYPSLMKYFQDYLIAYSKYWHNGNRFIQHFPIDSNKYASKIKDVIMSNYSKKPIRRICDLIPTLLSFDKRYLTNVKNKLCDSKNLNHVSGMKISTSSVCKYNEEIYEICDNSKRYRIFNKHVNCKYRAYCYDKCNIDQCVNLCCHMYVCSCEDSSCFCAHIHKLHSLFFTENKLKSYMNYKIRN